MKIYCVDIMDRSANRTRYYAPTKKAALKIKREEGADAESVEIDEIEFNPTREGICDRLNFLIQFYCLNEH